MIVSLQRQAGYEPAAVKKAIESLITNLGGMPAFIKKGDRVVLKPNLVMGYAPERAVTTHPAVVRAVAELALDCGGKVAIGDSPGLGSSRSAGAKAGLLQVAEELGLEWLEFTPQANVNPQRMFIKLELAKELQEADLVINLAKLKTHCQMLMTMAVKNMFGAVVGSGKFQWHYRAGRDQAIFARMLCEICDAIKPGLNIVDAIVGMDGNGPTSGQPNPTGFLAAGANPYAVDAICLQALGISWEQAPILQAARTAGNSAWEKARTVGEDPALLRPASWQLPETQSLEMHAQLPVPEFLKPLMPGLGRWLRSQLTAVPYAIKDICIKCGTCVKICPAKAMSLTSDDIVITKSLCIRCYCCHELCPHHAIGLRRGWLGKMIGVFRKKS